MRLYLKFASSYKRVESRYPKMKYSVSVCSWITRVSVPPPLVVYGFFLFERQLNTKDGIFFSNHHDNPCSHPSCAALNSWINSFLLLDRFRYTPRHDKARVEVQHCQGVPAAGEAEAEPARHDAELRAQGERHYDDCWIRGVLRLKKYNNLLLTVRYCTLFFIIRYGRSDYV